MKALSVCQPFAWLIVSGPKRVENRTWPTNYRGRLLIHASKSRAWLKELERLPDDVPPVDALAFGAIVGAVDLVDCLPLADAPVSPYTSGPWCWILEKPYAVEPVAWRGGLSLFHVPDDLVLTREDGRGCRRRHRGRVDQPELFPED